MIEMVRRAMVIRKVLSRDWLAKLIISCWVVPTKSMPMGLSLMSFRGL